jgi:hypothetical protein
MEEVRALMESYPDIVAVFPKTECEYNGKIIKVSNNGSYSFSYLGNNMVCATVYFWKTQEKGGMTRFWYEQNTGYMNLNPPIFQESVDATWPIMKRIEDDLVNKIGLKDFRDKIEVSFWFTDNPDDENRGVLTLFEEAPKRKEKRNETAKKTRSLSWSQTTEPDDFLCRNQILPPTSDKTK